MRRNQNDSPLLWLLPVPVVLWLAALLATEYKAGMTVFTLMGRFSWLMEHPLSVRWTPYTLKFMLGALIAYGFAVALCCSTRENRRPGEEHGSAKWGSAKQLNAKYRDKDPRNNTILTQNVRMSLNGKMHRRNLLQIVIGGSGAGKTRFFVKPNLMEANCSFLVTDPKGETLRAVAPLLLQKGYVIKVFDLIDPARSDSFNAFAYVNAEQFDLLLTSDFQWDGSGAVRFFYFRDQATYSAQLRLFTEERQYFVTEAQEWPEQSRIFRLQDYLDAVKYMPQAEIRQLSPDADGYSVVMMESGAPGDLARSITYDAGGVGTLDGWYIHLAVLPLHEDRSSSGDETIHLFYGAEEGSAGPSVTRWVDYTQTPDEMDWDGELTAQLPQFPGVTFRYTPYEITADGGDGSEPAMLISGMPIWNVYFCDLTGDGLPELCAALSWGSGMVDNRVVIYDYANGASYGLEDRANYDYTLRYDAGEDCLWVEQRDYKSGELVSSGRLVYEDGCIQVPGLET